MKTIEPLKKLIRLVKGREVEVHIKPRDVSVYVRGDQRDCFCATVAHGYASNMSAAISKAIKDWDEYIK